MTVPAASLVGTTLTPGTTELTYSMTVPMDVAPGSTLTNHAGVVSYEGPPANTSGSSVTYYPPSNIDPTAPANPAPRRGRTTPPPSSPAAATKAATTSVTSPGTTRSTQATIGEQITYTVSATVPAGTSVDDGTLSDPLGPAGTGPLDLVAGRRVPPWTAARSREGSP